MEYHHAVARKSAYPGQWYHVFEKQRKDGGIQSKNTDAYSLSVDPGMKGTTDAVSPSS